MHCFGFPKDGADLQEKRTLWEGVKREEKFFHWGCTDNGAMRHAGSWTMGLYASSSPFLSLISLPPHPLFCIYSILLFYEFIVIFCNFSEFILIFGNFSDFVGVRWWDQLTNLYQMGRHQVTFPLWVIRSARKWGTVGKVAWSERASVTNLQCIQLVYDKKCLCYAKESNTTRI